MFAMVREFVSLRRRTVREANWTPDPAPGPWEATPGPWNDWSDREKSVFCREHAQEMSGNPSVPESGTPGFHDHCNVFTM